MLAPSFSITRRVDVAKPFGPEHKRDKCRHSQTPHQRQLESFRVPNRGGGVRPNPLGWQTGLAGVDGMAGRKTRNRKVEHG